MNEEATTPKRPKVLGPDEISDLAECLWDACAEAEEKGGVVTAEVVLTKPTMCPFGALLGGPAQLGGMGFPGPTTVASHTRLSREDVDAFMRGFSEPNRVKDGIDTRPMAELGYLFRKQSSEGGFKR